MSWVFLEILKYLIFAVYPSDCFRTRKKSMLNLKLLCILVCNFVNCVDFLQNKTIGTIFSWDVLTLQNSPSSPPFITVWVIKLTGFMSIKWGGHWVTGCLYGHCKTRRSYQIQWILWHRAMQCTALQYITLYLDISEGQIFVVHCELEEYKRMCKSKLFSSTVSLEGIAKQYIYCFTVWQTVFFFQPSYCLSVLAPLHRC